ncbi:MAG: DNA repair protein RecO [Rhodospirillales bacterium]|nr:MAG: DNA repair protein RecO [Rhodospirillales bacterium]
MQWIDDALVLSARRHGDTAAVVTLLTREHGRHGGLVRGAAGRNRGGLVPGTLVRARWRGRLADHLGSLACEALASVDAAVMTDPDRLAGLVAACAVAETALPDREPSPGAYAALGGLIRALADPSGWLPSYVAWEVRLLAELGFGLDLHRCTVTGGTDDLVYVSPRTGRAVGRAAGAAYHDRLLRLPRFLTDSAAPWVPADLVDGLLLTGFFLARHVYAEGGRDLPPARLRLLERVRRRPAG